MKKIISSVMATLLLSGTAGAVNYRLCEAGTPVVHPAVTWQTPDPIGESTVYTVTTYQDSDYSPSCYDMDDPSLLVEDTSGLPYPVADGQMVDDTQNSPTECAAWDTGSRDSLCQSWPRHYVFPSKTQFDSANCVVGPRPLQGLNTLTATQSQIFASCGAASSFPAGGWQDNVTQCGAWYRRDSNATCSATGTRVNADGSVTQTQDEFDYTEKAGCGFCIAPVADDSCYAQTMTTTTASSLGLDPNSAQSDDSCQNLATNGEVCSLTSSTTVEVEGNLERARKEIYTCTTSKTRCVEYEKNNLCMETDLTFGLQPPAVAQQNTQSLTNAMAVTAQMQAAGQSIQQTPIDRNAAQEGWLSQNGVPKLFGGEQEGCEKPANSFFGSVMNNCCTSDLSRDANKKPSNDCTMGELKLSTAKRKHLTVYLGDYCVQDIRLKPSRRRICIKKRESYCKFEDLLPRIVQEQGRQQLDTLYAKTLSGASATVQPASWTLYSANNAYAWVPVANNGDQKLHAYQWPAYCKDVDSAYTYFKANPGADPCPDTLGLWVAVCESTSCSVRALPTSPMDGEANGWKLRFINPFVGKNHVVGNSILMDGSCVDTGNNNANCSFSTKMYPKGSGGKAFVTNQMRFSLMQDTESRDSGMVKTDTNTAMSTGMTLAGDAIVRARVTPILSPNSMPATIDIEYSSDNGHTFSSIAVSTDNASGVALGGTGLTIDGSCDKASLSCAYRIVSEQRVCPPGVYGGACIPLKPWMPTGAPDSADCSGFTPAQFSLLNMGEMNLDEWMQSLQAQMGTQNQAADQASAVNDASQMKAVMMGGGNSALTLNKGALSQGIKLTPTEEWGPFTATIRVATNYPEWYEKASENTNPVSSVSVDWGDCTPITILQLQAATIGSQTGSSFTAHHNYASPKDLLGCVSGSDPATIEHKVTITITAADGQHVHSVSVRNVWDDYVGTTGNKAMSRDVPTSRPTVSKDPSAGGASAAATPGPHKYLQ